MKTLLKLRREGLSPAVSVKLKDLRPWPYNHDFWRSPAKFSFRWAPWKETNQWVYVGIDTTKLGINFLKQVSIQLRVAAFDILCQDTLCHNTVAEFGGGLDEGVISSRALGHDNNCQFYFLLHAQFYLDNNVKVNSDLDFTFDSISALPRVWRILCDLLILTPLKWADLQSPLTNCWSWRSSTRAVFRMTQLLMVTPFKNWRSRVSQLPCRGSTMVVSPRLLWSSIASWIRLIT